MIRPQKKMMEKFRGQSQIIFSFHNINFEPQMKEKKYSSSTVFYKYWITSNYYLHVEQKFKEQR
jgi:hypothetical protein